MKLPLLSDGICTCQLAQPLAHQPCSYLPNTPEQLPGDMHRMLARIQACVLDGDDAPNAYGSNPIRLSVGISVDHEPRETLPCQCQRPTRSRSNRLSSGTTFSTNLGATVLSWRPLSFALAHRSAVRHRAWNAASRHSNTAECRLSSTAASRRRCRRDSFCRSRETASLSTRGRHTAARTWAPQTRGRHPGFERLSNRMDYDTAI